jgi:hypothetical protein
MNALNKLGLSNLVLCLRVNLEPTLVDPRVGSWPYPQILDEVGTACQEQLV